MLRLQSTVQTLLQHNTFGFARPKPHVVVSLNQRLRKYARQPEKYRRITLIRPPNLRDPNLVFPIKIPMRIRHLRIKWKKPLFTPNTKKMDWSRMTPNEMLLAF